MTTNRNRQPTDLGEKVKLLFDPGVIALNQAIELEERPPARSLSLLMFGICSLLVTSLIWSAFARLDIVTNAHGSVMPVGELVAIQNLEGGIVSEILVSEGELVEAGQTLLRLAPLDTQGRLDLLAAKRAAHLLAIEVERAIVESPAPDFTKAVDGFEKQKVEQQSFYDARMRALTTERAVLNAQIAQRRASVERNAAQLMLLRRDEQRANEELDMRRDLLERKLTTRDRFYAAEQDAAGLQKQRLSTRDELARANSELVEYQRRLIALDDKGRAGASEAITKHIADMGEVQASLDNELGREGRLNVKAPVAGIVMGLSVKAINAVVKPSEPLMQIVPTNEPLVVMADVQPQDIAYVALGQRAAVRISAFDYSIYGTLPGTVDRISAAAFSDRDGREFYKIRVRLERDYFGSDTSAARLIPGMYAEADIKTGNRSVLTYLLKPVARTLDTALREP